MAHEKDILLLVLETTKYQVTMEEAAELPSTQFPTE